LSSALG